MTAQCLRTIGRMYLPVTVAVFASLGGCRQPAAVGPDMAFLTEQALPVKQDTPTDLFPSALGNHWSLTGTTAGKSYALTMAVLGSKRIGKTTGVVLETRLDGKQIQQEVLAVDHKGIRRLAGGKNADALLVPPMTILQYPIQDGDAYVWNGALRTGGRDIPAQSYSEVTGPEHIVTRAGSFQAYRLDMVISVTADRQNVRVPSTFWFAPGVGIVKQESVLGTRQASAELKTYRVKQSDSALF